MAAFAEIVKCLTGDVGVLNGDRPNYDAGAPNQSIALAENVGSQLALGED